MQRGLSSVLDEHAREQAFHSLTPSKSGLSIWRYVQIHKGHRTVIDRLGDDSDVGRHLGAVAAALGLRNTVLLHERLFVGVEGISEQSAFPILFRLATGNHLESCGIALWACRNNEGATDFAKFPVEHERQVVFIIDSDSKSAKRNVFSDKKLMEK